MLKTNSKKAMQNVDAYLLQCADSIAAECDQYLLFDYNLDDIGDLCRCIYYDYFIPEAVQHDKRYEAGRISLQDLFIEWAQGLTAGGVFNFWLYRADADPVEILGDILEETQEERHRFSDTAAAEKLTYLIYRRVQHYCGM